MKPMPTQQSDMGRFEQEALSSLISLFSRGGCVPPTRSIVHRKLVARDALLRFFHFLSLSTLYVYRTRIRIHACNRVWSKTRCIFNSHHASILVEIGPIIRSGREFTTKEAEPPPPAFDVISFGENFLWNNWELVYVRVNVSFSVEWEVYSLSV